MARITNVIISPYKIIEIHHHARICTRADVYDALTGKCSYKGAKKPVDVLKIMYKEMANHFKKESLENFISLFREKQ